MSMADFWACSLWEFQAAVSGWNRSQGGDDTVEEMSEVRYEEMLRENGYR